MEKGEHREKTPEAEQSLVASVHPSPKDFYTQCGYVPCFNIGKGMSGTVMLAAPRDGSNNLVAVKSFTKKTGHRGMKSQRLFFREVAILQRIEHKNILGNIMAFDCPNEFVIKMPYYPEGCLSDHLPYLTNQKIDKYMLQLTSALLYLHGHHLVHRDIKPGNVLISDDGNVILSDFGIACVVTSTSMSDVGQGGTKGYKAPELMDMTRQHFNLYKCDMYSLGVVLFAMLSRQQPGLGVDYMACVKDKRSNTGHYRTILEYLLQEDPEMRWDAEGLIVSLAALPHMMELFDQQFEYTMLESMTFSTKSDIEMSSYTASK